MSEAVSASSSSDEIYRPSALAWVFAVLLAVLFGVVLLVYPPLKDAAAAVDTPVWTKFLGRFHVLALHLPVGILILAALMEFFVLIRHRTSHFLAPATTFALMAGAAGAVVAVIFGIFLARRGNFDSASFYAHQYLGIATAIGALLTIFLKLGADIRGGLMWPYRIVFGSTLALMAVGAHFGGNMVHDSDYLTKYAPAPMREGMEGFEKFVLSYFQPIKRHPNTPVLVSPVKPSKTATVYAALIAPVLAEKCTSCHNEEKAKAELRLDTHELIMKGGENGEVVVVGKPEDSKLIKCLTLPMDDDDHMPPPKKDQPTADEIALLTWWVKEGAKKDLTVAAAKVPENLKTYVKTLLATGKTGGAGGTPPIMLTLAEAAAQANPAIVEAMKKINGTGASLAPVAADSKELRFTALNVAKDYTDANLKDLDPVAGTIVALDLSKTKVTDAACASIAKMSNLRELHLENTGITDAGATQLKALSNLEYLNLYGTKITDKTLAELSGLTKLKAVYLWQSGITKAGADAFKAKHPGAVVNDGWTEADNAKAVAAAAPAPAKPAATPAAAPAKPVAAPAAVVTAKAVDPNASVYKAVIVPILAAKCTSCHGTEKSKGKLKLHDYASIMKGGSDGATTVIAGKPDDSLMIKRITLAADDDDHMPPKDEKQTTKEEAAILRWWIEQGASDSVTFAAAKKTPEVEAMLKTVAMSTDSSSSGSSKPDKPKAKALTPEEKKIAAEVTAKMKAVNASLMPIAQDTEQLRFGCVNAADKFTDKELAQLEPAASLILWMDLGRSKVTDAGLATVAKMKDLERLHLENTVITDAGLAQLAGLGKLEYLNLYGTKITDAGIAKLAANKSLKKLFVWETGVTKDGAKKLEAAVPGLVVNIGLSAGDIAKLVEENKPPEAPKGAPAVKKGDAKKAAPAPAKPAAAAPADEKKPK